MRMESPKYDLSLLIMENNIRSRSLETKPKLLYVLDSYVSEIGLLT